MSSRPWTSIFSFSRLASYSKSISCRHYSTPPSSSSAPKDPRSRLRKLNDCLPSFLRSYTTPLLGAPVTHITSFLMLHEITAIVPLFGLVGAFHYGNWMPDFTTGSSGTAFEEGTQKFGRWLRKKGWVEDVDVDLAMADDGVAKSGADGQIEPPKERQEVRLVLEFATAYAVTKALLPFRLAGSVWATPWFARRIVEPASKRIRSAFGK